MRKYYSITLIFVSILLFSIETFAQKSIRGVVKDSNLEPLEYATVILYLNDSLVNATITNQKGEFELKNITNDRYTLNVSYINFATFQKKIEFSDNLNLGIISLLKEDIQLDEIKVIGTTTAIKSSVNKDIYSVPAHLKNKTSDVYQIFQNVPRLIVNNFEKTVKIGDMGQTLILVNGVKRDDSYLMSLNPETISEIEVITCPSTKYLSKGISGVINIITKGEIIGQSANLSLGINPMLKMGHNNLNYRYNNRRFSIYLINSNFLIRNEQQKLSDIRIFNSNNDKITYEKQSEEALQTWISYWLKTGVEYRINSNSFVLFDLTGFYNPASFKRNYSGAIERLFNPKEYTTILHSNENNSLNQTYSLYFENRFNKGKDLLVLDANVNSFKINENTLYNEINGGNTFTNDNQNDYLKYSFDIQSDYTHAWEKINFNAGIRFYRQEVSTTNEYAESTLNNRMSLIEDKQYLYSEILYNVTSNFALQIGSGIDFVSKEINDKYNDRYYKLLPNIALLYSLNQNNKFKLDYYLHHEEPSPWQLNPARRSTDTLRIIVGNPFLKPYYSNIYKLSYSFSKGQTYLSPEISYEANDNRISNYGRVNNNGVFQETYQNIASFAEFVPSIYANFSLFTWWKFNGKVWISIQHFQDHANEVEKKHSSMGYMVNSSFNYKSLQLDVNIYKHQDKIESYSIYTSPIESSVLLQWYIKKNLSAGFGLRYILPWKSETLIKNQSYYQKTETSSIDRNLMILFNFSYRLNIGKQNYGQNKKVQNIDDSGHFNENL